MNNIYYRIDDRLIHGQVITAWTKYYELEKIIIIDNQVASDPVQCQVIDAVAPSNLSVKVLNNEAGYKEISNSKKNTLVLVKYPETILNLLNFGIDINEVIIGGMQFKNGRKQIMKTISITSKEAKDFMDIDAEGVELTVQIVPTDRKKKLIPVIKKKIPKGE